MTCLSSCSRAHWRSDTSGSIECVPHDQSATDQGRGNRHWPKRRVHRRPAHQAHVDVGGERRSDGRHNCTASSARRASSSNSTSSQRQLSRADGKNTRTDTQGVLQLRSRRRVATQPAKLVPSIQQLVRSLQTIRPLQLQVSRRTTAALDRASSRCEMRQQLHAQRPRLHL